MRPLLSLLLLASALIGADASVTPAQPVALSVQVSGGTAPFAYQWRKDGALIAGATGATLTVAQPGAYSCVVSNRAGSATSNTLTIDSVIPPSGVTITVKPSTAP